MAAMAAKSLSPCSDQWYVFGLVSFSDKFCGHYQNSNTAFISTIKHRKWILQVSTSLELDRKLFSSFPRFPTFFPSHVSLLSSPHFSNMYIFKLLSLNLFCSYSPNKYEMI